MVRYIYAYVLFLQREGVREPIVQIPGVKQELQKNMVQNWETCIFNLQK